MASDATASPWLGSLALDTGWALFVGSTGQTDLHAHHAIQIGLSADAPMVWTLADGRSLRGRSLAVASDVPHAIAQGASNAAHLLRRILAVAEVHRFHHRPSSGEGDVNFGLFTTFVDHALGTYHWELEAPREDQDIGIGAEPDYPTGYIAQLMQPFRTRRDQPATAS